MASLREKLIGPPAAFGSWLALDSTIAAETMGRAGFDALVIDLQHGGNSEGSLLGMLQALELAGTPALVRVQWNEPAGIMRVADLGAAGVIVPMVSTRADAESAVAAIRYPPRGIRSFGPVRRWYAPGGANEEALLIAMIETREGLDHVEEIAATPGLDGLLVGPVDLALSLGHSLSLEMPGQVLDALGKVAAACSEHGLICASVSFGTENAAAQIARGVTFLTSGSDSIFMRRGAEAELAVLRALAAR